MPRNHSNYYTRWITFISVKNIKSERKRLLVNIKYESILSTKLGEGVLEINGKLFLRRIRVKGRLRAVEWKISE